MVLNAKSNSDNSETNLVNFDWNVMVRLKIEKKLIISESRLNSHISCKNL